MILLHFIEIYWLFYLSASNNIVDIFFFFQLYYGFIAYAHTVG